MQNEMKTETLREVLRECGQLSIEILSSTQKIDESLGNIENEATGVPSEAGIRGELRNMRTQLMEAIGRLRRIEQEWREPQPRTPKTAR